jgi:hypothetical protein
VEGYGDRAGAERLRLRLERVEHLQMDLERRPGPR